ncbi:divergent polysaccharide deacetylase family protein [Roseomonas sp. NAR14]|uniref:Divergent polysaccharide deacetylase family protein n=1 Tax=Roseomonas acroporae TaxID=2937791 RepID=A0A9X1YC86_9PROT|nr:divergent polysaccharide deacetylase family protein [Roseomonas acroporae]MCK8786518.1 divergent polysaccharide deacetylase family protein [Roseomonas acroporae]
MAVAAPAIPPPDPALIEESRQGPLPRVAADGRTPIRTYARPFDRADRRPRLGIVIAGMGLSGAMTEDAIRRLPPAVSLAFSPYAVRLDPMLAKARARGIEVMVSLPLEPAGYPLNDPGDHALLTGLPLVENLDRLDWSLSRFAGYVGAVGALGAMRGERFAAMGDLLGTVQDVLRGRGLLYIDPRPGAVPGALPRAWGRGVDIVLDDPATRGEIERRLAELERLAREHGAALGLAGDPTPVLVERIAGWAAGLEARGVVLAPVSALIRRPGATPEAPPEAAARPAARLAGETATPLSSNP